jgi:hypothetical protein
MTVYAVRTDANTRVYDGKAFFCKTLLLKNGSRLDGTPRRTPMVRRCEFARHFRPRFTRSIADGNPVICGIFCGNS